MLANIQREHRLAGMSGRVQYDSNFDRVTDYWMWGIAEHGDKFEVVADVKDNKMVELVSRQHCIIENYVSTRTAPHGIATAVAMNSYTKFRLIFVLQ